LVHTGSERQAKLSETPLEIFIQESVKDGVEAAVGVTQGDAEMQAGHHVGVLLIYVHQCPDDDEDVDGCPADDEGCHHHQHHARDAPQVAVFLLGAREEAHAPQAKDHQPVADGDDQDGDHEGKDEDTDLGHCVPVDGRIGKLERAQHHPICGKEDVQRGNGWSVCYGHPTFCSVVVGHVYAC